MASKLKVQRFRTNDLINNGGKQFELGKAWCEDFFEISPTLSEAIIPLIFKPLCSEHNRFLNKEVELKLANVTNRGDRKAYANGRDGLSQIKDLFIYDLGLTEKDNLSDYFAVYKTNTDQYYLYYIPQMLYNNFIKLFESAAPDVSIQRDTKRAFDHTDEVLSLQQIFYGAPGTGKSHEIKEKTQGDDTVVRTTFHPDSDYSTFVGCYKPTKETMDVLSLHKLHELYPDFKKSTINRPLQRFIVKYHDSFRLLTEKEAESVFDKIETPSIVSAEVPKVMAAIEDIPTTQTISYSFVPQSFTKAYIQAWKKMCDTSLWTKKATAMPPTGIDATPYKRTGKTGDVEVFARDKDSVALLKDEEKAALLEVDNFDFPFDGINNFGELHDQITVVVTDLPTEEQNKSYRNRITFTAEQIRELFRTYKETHEKINPNTIPILLHRIAEKLDRWLSYNPEVFEELAKYDGEDITVEVDESNSLLGLYDSATKTVYLFKRNIGKNIKLLCAVYIHEMFHAYYDTGNKYIPEIEEPIVECNTLCFLELFNLDYCDSYLESIGDKQYTASFNYYGFGAHLYENRSLNWMRLYQKSYNHIDDSSTIVNEYRGMFSPIYPFGNERTTRNLLYNILNPQEDEISVSKRVSQYLIIEEINRGNCAQIFGDLFQLLDRKEGYSEYPIEADDDLRKELENEFVGLKFGVDIKKRINDLFRENYPSGITDKILSGKLLVLPENLFIWATMNTSDQSLFPIDSAFKRRWDWTYIPIKKSEKDNYKIEVNEVPYDWWSFIDQMNKVVEKATESEDKKMGYYFCKPDKEEGVISTKKFVNKVLFYLYNDVFKDNGLDWDLDGQPVFKYTEDKDKEVVLTFAKYFNPDGSPNESCVERLMKNLNVEENSDLDAEYDGESSKFKLDGKDMSLRDIAKEVVLKYANDNPSKSAQEVRDYFVSLCKGIGVAHIVETETEYHERDGQPSQERTVSEITIPGGEKLYVSTQWKAKNKDDNFIRFLEIVNSNGLGTISK